MPVFCAVLLAAIACVPAGAQAGQRATTTIAITASVEQRISVDYSAGGTGNQNGAIANVSGTRKSQTFNDGPAASVLLQGAPSQTFAVSLYHQGVGAGRFSHDAGTTPHLSAKGNSAIYIEAAVIPNQTAAYGIPQGSLDVIVSHN